MDRPCRGKPAERALAGPDQRITSRGGRDVLVRRYADRALAQPMVVCVVVEERPEETVVVTVYKSSKVDKYAGGGAA